MILNRLKQSAYSFQRINRLFSTTISHKVLVELTEDSPYKFRNYTPPEQPNLNIKLHEDLQVGFRFAYEQCLKAISEKNNEMLE